jgi:hypothetical protein
MKTATVIIGNSDNKLTQQEWSQFVGSTFRIVDNFATQVHFSGGPDTASRFQNFAWVVVIDDADLERLKTALKHCREAYRQASAALVVGETQFI